MGGKYANVLETIGRTPVIRINRAPRLAGEGRLQVLTRRDGALQKRDNWRAGGIAGA